ncbi:hypothetical protein GCM10022403_032840 [Streptomyces coacervatus]|uniref:Zinc-binding dehydrogenase n=1 Tax=Streptomyces coacervatus TaxID=647381 RepID=A0ABP7HN47_9ACTN|nr:zinc-binding dehydrogenase [Streptomyces coacervatus]MDF2272381.1 zinc-binding dehydrogenase [Streptomyces coacervatus]
MFSLGRGCIWAHATGRSGVGVARLRTVASRGGGNVFVVGASGGVGVYAVQIAAALGADVTAIGGRNSAPRLKELGATTVHSYRDTSFEDLTGIYDIVFDLSGRLRFGQVTKKLSRTGTFVNVNPHKDPAGMIASLFSRRKAPFVYVPHSSAMAQTRILDMVVNGAITPVVEEAYDIGQFRTAFTDLTRNERFGKIVISY